MRVLMRFTCGFLAAVAFTLTAIHIPASLILAGCLVIPAILLLRRIPGVGVILLGVLAGLIYTSGYKMITDAVTIVPVEQEVIITGTAVDYSTETTYGIRVPARIQDGERSAQAMVWLSTKQSLSPGDLFSVQATLKSSGSGKYFAEGYYVLAFGSGNPEIIPSERLALRYLPRWIAHKLGQSLERSMPQDTLGYALALTTGDRSNLTVLDKEDLEISGIYHMLALSGMHMAVLVSSITALTRKRRLRAAIGIPLCFAFAIITGGTPSVVRAAVMQSVVLLAPVLHWEEDGLTSLSLAALLITLQNPNCVLGWSMQLSFASMLGIILIAPKISKALHDARSPRHRRKWTRWISASFTNTAAASLVVTPLLMAFYGRISLISPITNLLTGWIVAWCFRGSLLTAVLGLFGPIPANAIGWCTGWLIRYVRLVAGVLSKVPFASLSTDAVYGAAWVVFAYLVLLTTILIPGRKRPTIPACCVVSGLVFCLGFTLLQNNAFQMTVLDVGQGQCILTTAHGQCLLIDCGGSLGEGAGDLAADTMEAMGENRVDALLLTHYDLDHVSGALELMNRVQVCCLLLPDTEPDSATRQLIVQSARDHGATIQYVTETMTAALCGGTMTFYPPVLPGQENSSLSVLMNVQETQVLITGDMDEVQETLLLEQVDLPQVDVLIAGHHGSKYSTSSALLNKVMPKTVVISVGKNSYGHPAQETLDRIAGIGAAVYRTDQNGTIRLRGA